MPDDLVLFGVASDGKVEQWDGLQTPHGILLRWFHARDLGFPDYGYDLYRSRVPDIPALVWHLIAPFATGQTEYNHADEVLLGSESGFQFDGTMNDMALVVQPGDRITLTFPDAAWFLSVEPSPHVAGTVTAEIFAGGESREVRQLVSGDPPWIWRTRGIERVELTGNGAVRWIRYGLLNSPRRWTHLVHLCLPVSDPSYLCSPQPTGTDEDEAKSRVPPGVDWVGRYSTGFGELHPYLKALATRTPMSFPASIDPDPPELGMEPDDAVELAALDPHIARVLGLAWDDPVQLDGTEWSYKLVGRWKGSPTVIAFDSLDALVTLSEAGVRVALDLEASEIVDGGIAIRPSREGPLRLDFAAPKDVLVLELRTEEEVRWRAYNEAEELLADGSFHPHGNGRDPFELEVGVGERPRGTDLRIEAAGMRSVELITGAVLTLYSISVAGPPVERFTILPSIYAADPGPPKSPSWLLARAEQPGGTAGPLQAAITWELQASAAGVYEENACVLYQVAGYQLSTDLLAAQPQPPLFHRSYLLNSETRILVPSETAAGPQPPARYYTDSGLSEGWRCWWARGIDLFGRVSDVSPPDVEKLEDSALPPPPVVLHTEYAQSDLPAQQAAMLGRSGLAREWMTANPNSDGIVIVWGWTPELEDLAADVDGFRVYVRRPVPVPNPGPNDPERTYAGISWGAARAEVGPIPVRIDGQVTAATTYVPSVTVTGVTPLDDQHAVCTTDLDLESGGGALIGATLQAGTAAYEVVSHGEGPEVSLTVEHLPAAPPSPGAYEIHAGTAPIARVVTDLTAPGLGGAPIRRRFAGALVTGDERLMVIGRSGGTFLCRLGTGATLPPVGAAVSWYPAYAVVVEDTGFGPAASPSEPVANAQVTVRSVRRWSGRQLESSEATPGLLTAVDVTPPPTPPPIDPIRTGPYCAEVATRADWYGISRFTLSWTPAAGVGYIVYRALGDAIFRLDLAAHTQGTTPAPHSFPQSVWPAAMWNDTNRKQVVLSDLAALDAAISGGDAQAIETAYEALHADAQQLIAGQQEVEGAYAALNGTPLAAAEVPFVDELDGRSRAHWFYRIACRTSSGLEGAMGPPTPPICCPDVVPPAPPLVQLALADANGGKIKLQWQVSPERDLVRYLLYRTTDEESAGDVRSMALTARIAASPSAALATGEVAPTAVAGKQWLEYADQAPGGHDWLYRIVAEDVAGNRSEPSRILRGRAIIPPPAPPVWETPTRGATSVTLSWKHPSDQRLSCLVERRESGTSLWLGVSNWLPRGLYTYTDEPPDLAAGWEYRLRVRDHQGQVAASIPSTTLPAVP